MIERRTDKQAKLRVNQSFLPSLLLNETGATRRLKTARCASRQLQDRTIHYSRGQPSWQAIIRQLCRTDQKQEGFFYFVLFLRARRRSRTKRTGSRYSNWHIRGGRTHSSGWRRVVKQTGTSRRQMAHAPKYDTYNEPRKTVDWPLSPLAVYLPPPTSFT